MDNLNDKRVCITITFSDVVENGVGMQKLGCLGKCPFTHDKLIDMANKFSNDGYDIEFIDLSQSDNKASVLVFRNYLSNPKGLFDELTSLSWDSKALFRGQVKNKRARHNLCFADIGQEANYEKGMGTVVKFKDLPLLDDVKNGLHILYDVPLLAEGNLYYDIAKCGIGYHGDTERSTVIGLRLGEDMKLCFQWFHQTKPVGDKYTINLHSGDLYIMSDKAVGNDWKKRSQYTLRHAAGCDKYTVYKAKK
jgi:hypothetical protein